jgi:thiol-disulfide isomerase/thioredoxin
MPDFSYPSLAGVPWTLSEHHGRIVFVNFWATWCPPCREETPGFVRLHRLFRNRVEFAGVSLDDDPREAVPPFARRYGIEYPILIAPPAAPLVNAVEVLPTSFLVDPQGRVARTWTGAVSEDDLTDAIEALLQEAAVIR